MSIFNMIGGGGGSVEKYVVASGHGTYNAYGIFTFPNPIYISNFAEHYDALLIEIFRRQYPAYLTGTDNYYKLINMSVLYLGNMDKPMGCWTYKWNDSYLYYGSNLPNASTQTLKLTGSKPSVSPGIETVTYTGVQTILFVGDYNYLVFHMKSGIDL